MTGSFLRTNYRQTGRELDLLAIGEGIPKSSYGGGAGFQRGYGGFIMGSFATELVGFYAQSAIGAMSNWLGSVYVTNLDSGWRIAPIGYNLRLLTTSVATDVGNIFMTYSAAGDSMFRFYPGQSGSFATSSSSVGLVWWGFIISSPY